MKTTHAIRVLHVIDTLERGGAEMQLLDIFRNSSADDMELHLIAGGGGVLEDTFRASGHQIQRRDRRGPIDVGLCAYIREYCREHKIEVIHSHQIVSGVHAVLGVVGLSIPVIHTIHGFTEDLKNNLSLRFLLRRTAANILVSHSMADMVKRREHLRRIPRCHVIYNGIDAARLVPPDHGESFREELGLDLHDSLIGMVGNVYAVKDHVMLCRAMALLAPSHPELHCVIVGRVDDRQIYEECQNIIHRSKIEKQMHFLGARTDVGQILAELDAFVFSTKADTFGLAVVEAMMSGVPTLATDIPVMREVSCNGSFATLFDADHPGDLAQVIEQVLLNPISSQNKAREAMRYAQDTFGIRSTLYALRELYRSFRNVSLSQEMDLETDITLKSS